MDKIYKEVELKWKGGFTAKHIRNIGRAARARPGRLILGQLGRDGLLEVFEQKWMKGGAESGPWK